MKEKEECLDSHKQYCTVESEWVSVSEVDDGGKSLDAVSLGHRWVDDTDQADPEPVQLVVNLLQLHQDLVAGPAVGLHCKWRYMILV